MKANTFPARETEIKVTNADCIAWLKRTANHDIHGTTRKRPEEVFTVEKEYLIPVSEYSFVPATNESISYPIRKDNIILYKGNRYRVPAGTYHKGAKVFMKLDESKNELSIVDTITETVYAYPAIIMFALSAITFNSSSAMFTHYSFDFL